MGLIPVIKGMKIVLCPVSPRDKADVSNRCKSRAMASVYFSLFYPSVFPSGTDETTITFAFFCDFVIILDRHATIGPPSQSLVLPRG